MKNATQEMMVRMFCEMKSVKRPPVIDPKVCIKANAREAEINRIKLFILAV